jgi:hypothetical protein
MTKGKNINAVASYRIVVSFIQHTPPALIVPLDIIANINLVLYIYIPEIKHSFEILVFLAR